MTFRTVADNRLLHGGDYNPDQWLDYPEILKDDLRLMKQAKTNTFTLGVFAWSALEPTEGEFQFGWLDERIDAIHKMGGRVILATPSGARPAWMSKKYPEVLRTSEKRTKMLQGGRHNHCFSSPIYREKVAIINRKLAERYGNHPALLMWHISNEFSGDCHCDFCQANFRSWLKDKYETLEKLNHAWWGPFWSHTITEWSEIESPSSIGESMVHGLNLDWKRFVTDQTIDFYKHEIVPLREISPTIPITTNFMADTHDLIPFQSLNYSEFAKHVDIVSWDCYPAWHNDWEETKELASKVGFINDLYRSLKQQPFLIMESTPSGVNWHDVNKTKRPGMHLLSSLQFIAHGSDSILYFQWRKSRGSSEKFHGAVVDHDNSEDNRVFQDVSAVGGALEKIAEIKGTQKQAKVAIVYDWENNWALNDAQGFSHATKQYPQTLQKHYQSFWKKDISVDVVTLNQELSSYDLVIAPMLYMMSDETMSKLESYVFNGGSLVSSYISGLVDGTDLAHLSGWPAPLKRIFGMEVKETDILYPKDRNALIYNGKQYEIKDYCTIFENKEADVLATYMEDFYQGNPAVVKNSYGKGKTYFIGARTEQSFLDDLYEEIQQEVKLHTETNILHEEGVSVQTRESDDYYYFFVMNFTEQKQTITLKESFYDLLTQETKDEHVELSPYEVMVLRKEK